MNILGAVIADPGNMCSVDPATNIFLLEPIFDIDPRFTPHYHAFLATQNHLINRYSTTFPVMANQNDITVTGAEVELVDRNGRRLAIANSFYRTPAAGVIPSASGDQAGRGIADVEVIPTNVAAQLPALFADAPAGTASVVARVSVIGSTQGGSEVISSDFIIPIQLCVGCRYAPGIPPEGVDNGCLLSQDFVYIPGYASLTACETGDTCPSDLCVLGSCLP